MHNPCTCPHHTHTFCPFVLQCGAVIEAGNGAITPEGDAVLQRRGIPGLPVRGEDRGGLGGGEEARDAVLHWRGILMLSVRGEAGCSAGGGVARRGCREGVQRGGAERGVQGGGCREVWASRFCIGVRRSSPPFQAPPPPVSLL